MSFSNIRIGNTIVYSGVGEPPFQLGRQGDVFIRTDIPKIYINYGQNFGWDLIVTTGLIGSQGDIGFTGSRGFTGSKGQDGQSISISGTVDDVTELPPSGILGETYIINNELWIWSGQSFTNVGRIVGFTGSQGISGNNGINGINGQDGFTGSRGERGYTGSRGAMGRAGFVGSRGPIGLTGQVGFVGSLGFTGSKGDTGEGISVRGVLNSIGDLPPTGEDGEAYFVGRNLFVWSVNTWTDVGDVVGFTGSFGFTGSKGDIGFTGSLGGQGVTGFTGSRGLTGIQGFSGSRGFTGSQGAGFTGSRGDIGFTGQIGFTGSQGAGFTGSQGVTGFTGSLGLTGSQGVIGFTGSTGDIGFTGQNGFTGSQGAGFTGSQGVIGYTGSQGVIGFTGSRGTSSFEGRTITGTTNQISVEFGNGVDGNPTISAVIADQITTEEGSDNTSLMTALTTKQSINSQISQTTDFIGFTGSNRIVTTGTIQNVIPFITPSGAANWTPDWSQFINANWIITGGRTLINPTNVIPGTTRIIRIASSTSTSRALSYGTAFKGTLPASVTNTSVVLLTLYAVSQTEIIVAQVDYTI